MREYATLLCLGVALVFGPGRAQGAATLDVYESSDLTTPLGQIQTLATAQSGLQHYDYYSDSGHPAGVNLGPYNSNLWVHEDTSTGAYTFGFIFSQDKGGVTNEASLLFRVVDSGANVYVAQSDDFGEATETSPGAFEGDYWYSNNTDGIAVSGITGSDWTIIIDSVDFGNVTDWHASGGDGDMTLVLGEEYRITPEGHTPSGAPVCGQTGIIPSPGAVVLGSLGVVLVGYLRGRKAF